MDEGERLRSGCVTEERVWSRLAVGALPLLPLSLLRGQSGGSPLHIVD